MLLITKFSQDITRSIQETSDMLKEAKQFLTVSEQNILVLQIQCQLYQASDPGNAINKIAIDFLDTPSTTC